MSLEMDWQNTYKPMTTEILNGITYWSKLQDTIEISAVDNFLRMLFRNDSSNLKILHIRSVFIQHVDLFIKGLMFR